jgi:hypothetical protein
VQIVWLFLKQLVCWDGAAASTACHGVHSNQLQLLPSANLGTVLTVCCTMCDTTYCGSATIQFTLVTCCDG